MRRRIWLRGLLMAAIVMAALTCTGTGAALAASVHGSGTLEAQGSGHATIKGSGEVRIEGGAGVVWVSGADELTAEGTGRRTILPDGTVRLTGYTGAITASGDDLTVRVSGRAIELSASGSGSAWLRGKGTYTTESTSGAWLARGLRVSY